MRAAILGPLVAYNVNVAGPSNHAPFALLLQDDNGATQGGLWADCFYDWLSIHLLVVPKGHRHQRLGTRLIRAAAAFTRVRGGTGMWLDTLTFPACGFYEKQGFICFGELTDHPKDGSRLFMQKRL